MATYQQGKFEQVNIFYPFSEGVIPSIFNSNLYIGQGCVELKLRNKKVFMGHGAFLKWCRCRRNRWPVASIFTVGPVKLNKDRPAGPVDILGPLGPATFVSSVTFNID